MKQDGGVGSSAQKSNGCHKGDLKVKVQTSFGVVGGGNTKFQDAQSTGPERQ